ncbi:MAG TPA: hypothetical protein VJM82_02805 [Nitrospiraceae bacterium]|nr:hypothetical protein [Nitrospiraceae bacterium]
MGKDTDRTGQRLTHDELKAAEAAFQGRPFNEAWSQAARAIYDGILAAKIKLNHEPFTRGLPAPNRDPMGAEELVGAAAHCGDEEGFNGL